MRCHIPSKRSRQPSGFTLIELLTVIAIIGILAAILVPTVGKVRDTAKKAQCVARLRQWGNVVSLCANDHKSYIPIFFKDGNGELIYDPYISSQKMLGDETKIGSIGRNLLPTEAFTLCPNGFNNDNTTGGNVYQYSFVVPTDAVKRGGSLFKFPAGTDVYMYKAAEAAAPGQLILMIEQNNGKNVVNTTGGIKTALASPAVRRVQLDKGYVRHSGIANALFVDGHVRGLTISDTDYDDPESKKKLDRWFALK